MLAYETPSPRRPCPGRNRCHRLCTMSSGDAEQQTKFRRRHLDREKPRSARGRYVSHLVAPPTVERWRTGGAIVRNGHCHEALIGPARLHSSAVTGPVRPTPRRRTTRMPPPPATPSLTGPGALVRVILLSSGLRVPGSRRVIRRAFPCSACVWLHDGCHALPVPRTNISSGRRMPPCARPLPLLGSYVYRAEGVTPSCPASMSMTAKAYTYPRWRSQPFNFW